MKVYAFVGLVSALVLSACASSDAYTEPKALPDNWKVADINNDYAPELRGTVGHNGAENATATSLWSSSPKSLFGDRRASQYGDILTVVIEIDDEAEIKNSVDQTRSTQQDFSLGAFFGLPELVNQNLPAGSSMSPAVDLSRGSSVSGNGNIKRGEKITLRLAARVTDVMPNGYLSLSGRQEIMVNNEARFLQVTGLVRTQDISRLNTITYDKIAEARIFYGGKGQITDAVRPRFGNKTLSKILPF